MFRTSLRRFDTVLAIALVVVLACAVAMSVFNPAPARAQSANVCPTNPSPPDAADPSIIVDSPVAGAKVTSPVTIAGDARTFEANVQIRILDAQQNVIKDTFTMASEGAPALAPFSESVAFSVSSEQNGCVMVFEGSAMDGSPRNVVLVPVVLAASQGAPSPPETGTVGPVGSDDANYFVPVAASLMLMAALSAASVAVYARR